MRLRCTQMGKWRIGKTALIPIREWLQRNERKNKLIEWRNFEQFNIIGIEYWLRIVLLTKIYSFGICKCVSTSAFRITCKFTRLSIRLEKPVKYGNWNGISFDSKYYNIFPHSVATNAFNIFSTLLWTR